MPFLPFRLEEWQSLHEQSVAINLADSGVQAVSLRELVSDPEEVERLLATSLHYPHVNGTPLLRERIAALYPGATAANVLVTVGASEANSIVRETLLVPGDSVAAMEPGYRQLWGLAQNLGCEVRAYHLRPERGWRPDLDELDARVDAGTRLIGVTNPANPTGTILTEAEMERIVSIAARHGAWILADEVYRGTERLTDRETPTFFGRYDRVVAVNSLSKAYGLPGLRAGWIVGPPATVDDVWRRHEYATIATGTLSMALGEIALEEPVRSRLLARNRALIRAGYARVERWIAAHAGLLSIVPPEATALAFVRVHLDAPSVDVAHALRERADVLVAPGDLFGVPHHLRLSHGQPAAVLDEALARIGAVLEELARSEQVIA